MTKEPTAKLLTTAMAAAKLGMNPDYVRELIRDGKIKATKLGHDWLMTEKAIAHIKRKRKRNTNGQPLRNDS